MKYTWKALAAFAALATLGTANLQAQKESPYRISFETKFVSQYLWRGFVANDTPSLQPQITF